MIEIASFFLMISLRCAFHVARFFLSLERHSFKHVNAI